jgi:hypothetical protein
MVLELNPPDWNSLVGGTVETSWIADRHRKLGIASTISEEIERVFNVLKNRNALFNATPESILSDRFAAQWYVSLAGFSQKTLVNTVEVPKKFGMAQKPSSLVESLADFCNRLAQGDVTAEQMPARIRGNLKPFADWVNHELDNTLSLEQRTPERVLIRVSLLLGGRIIGQGQNEGGNEGVILLKELLYRELSRMYRVEVRLATGAPWQQTNDASAIANAVEIRFDGRMVCDFTSGGNRPDIKVSLGGDVIAVGEIKARKDLSNLWESWMPQVTSHMKTWYSEFPNAARLFFGTVITQEMIEGASRMGTLHTGLRELVETHQMTAAYNLSQIVGFDDNAANGLKNFVDGLSNALEHSILAPVG